MRIILIAAIGAVALSHSAASAASSDASTRGTAYVDIRGELRFEFDREGKRFELYGIPSGAGGDASEPIERIAGRYLDCSNTTTVCFDFVEFALAVPKDLQQIRWANGDWQFRRTACLTPGNRRTCERFSAVFENKRTNAEGGFVFSSTAGVELFFHSKSSAKPIDALYILQQGRGLLADGHP